MHRGHFLEKINESTSEYESGSASKEEDIAASSGDGQAVSLEAYFLFNFRADESQSASTANKFFRGVKGGVREGFRKLKGSASMSNLRPSSSDTDSPRPSTRESDDLPTARTTKPSRIRIFGQDPVAKGGRIDLAIRSSSPLRDPGLDKSKSTTGESGSMLQTMGLQIMPARFCLELLVSWVLPFPLSRLSRRQPLHR